MPLSDISILVRPVAELKSEEWDEIWQLTNDFYDTNRDYAEVTLRRHEQIALFRSRVGNALVGMAALDICPVRFQGRRRVVIFTSHVLLAERYRGRNLLQRLGLRTFMRTRLRFPFSPIYWFFDTFSYKSYLLLPHNFRHFWPRYDRPTPTSERAFMNDFATQSYGASWQSGRGIVEHSKHKRLRPETAPLKEGLLQNPHLQFFARVNPAHAEGDMLVCLCPLNIANWWALAARWLRRGARRPAARPAPEHSGLPPDG